MAGKVYVTGDCHSEFNKFNTSYFPEQNDMDKDDYVIVCGDFGGIWNVGWENKKEKYWLDWLQNKSFTTLFVDGNHENFDRLNTYPQKEWKGGMVHEIRPSVLHLMRGQVFNIAGKKIFTLGGASSHDIDGGVLEVDDDEFRLKKRLLDEAYIPYRINHISWWKEELPNDSEYDTTSFNLEKHNFEVDYIITHCCSSSTQQLLSSEDEYVNDTLNDFLDLVKRKCKYKKWYFGHYHKDDDITENEVVLYDRIVLLGENVNRESE